MRNRKNPSVELLDQRCTCRPLSTEFSACGRALRVRVWSSGIQRISTNYGRWSKSNRQQMEGSHRSFKYMPQTKEHFKINLLFLNAGLIEAHSQTAVSF